MPHFLYVIGSLRSGGSERQLLYLVAALRERGVSATVAVWNYSDGDVHVGPMRATGAAVVAIGGRSRIGKWKALRSLIRTLRPDIVHSYSFYLNAIVASAAAGTKSIAVGSVRSTVALALADTGPLLGSLSARWPRRQVYNSTFAAEEAARRSVRRPGSIAVLPNYVDIERFSDVPAPNGERQIVGIGSLLPVKRWERLLALAVRLRERGAEFRVAIAGEGPLRPSLEAEIGRLGLGERVVLRGYVSNVNGLLAESAFLVHVSESEGSPNAVVEALAAGRPVIATDVGDVARLVRHGETGFIVPPDDFEALADRAELLLTDRALCEAMGRRAREAACAQFGSASLADNMLVAYQRFGWRSPA